MIGVVIYVLCISGKTFIDALEPSNWIGDASVYRNQLAIVNQIYADAKGENFNYVTYTPPIFDYPYQYLFLWMGKKEYGYMPNKNHEKLFYLIIEPDHQFPLRLENWLNVRESDGEIIYTKQFPSGIKLQKRIH